MTKKEKTVLRYIAFAILCTVTFYASAFFFGEEHEYILRMAFCIWGGFLSDWIAFKKDSDSTDFYHMAFTMAVGTCAMCIAWKLTGGNALWTLLWTYCGGFMGMGAVLFMEFQDWKKENGL